LKKNSSKNKVILILLLLILLVFNIQIISVSSAPISWNDEWKFFEEIQIPIDTGIQLAKYQPIDISIDFDNPCWAKNEFEHSIRVCCWNGKKWHELESQIYDLKSVSNSYISSCNIVFLIPDFADGNEIYYVYYSDSEKPSPNYIDHVQIEESYYHYEPISGYALESSYYKIIDNQYCNYIISQEGSFMGYNTCQHITKMNEKTLDIKPKNGDTIAAFDFKYSYGDDVFDYSSTSQKLISKEIINDGNIMIQFGMVSRSKLNDLQTTASYKYYHCPINSSSRIHVHIKHEALKDISLDKTIILDTNTDGTFATLQSQKVKSKTIDDLNLGKIYPFLHFNNEMNAISEFDIDLDPEYIPEDLDIRIISLIDDVDLGENSWVSFDEGNNGITNAIIFYSNDVLVQGNNEKNGLQINSYEMDYPHLPGLENNMANIVVSRNSIEKNEEIDTIIPQDYIVEFDAEYFTNYNNGYKILNEEANIFRKLIENKSEYKQDFENNIFEKDKHTLTIDVHNSPSIPMGSSLSALFGRNFSFISVELYQDDKYSSSGSAVRLPMQTMEEFDNSRILRTLLQSLKYFQWRNFSLFKRVIFSDIEEGKYVVKVFKENSIFSKTKQFIGFAIVDLKDDSKIDINCFSENQIKLIINDQNDNEIKDAVVLLKKDDSIISKTISNKKGEAEIRAPRNPNNYNLIILYKDILVYEDAIRLNNILNKRSDIISINIERYDVDLNIFDKWSLSPDIDLNPIIINDDQIIINSIQKSSTNYLFEDIPVGEYNLFFSYKSFIIKEKILINTNKNLNIEFPAEYKININTLDSRGIDYHDSIVYISRGEKKVRINEKENYYYEIIPPGEYNLEIYNDQDLIYKKNIDVFSDTKYDIITIHNTLYPQIFLSILLIVFILIIFYSYVKKSINLVISIIPIILILISIIFPWWTIQGSSNSIESSTSMYLYPIELITITTTTDTIAGEPSYLPELFILAIYIFLLITFVGCIIHVINIYLFKNKKKKIILLSKISSLIIFIFAISIFIFSINELSNITLGGMIGQGYIDSNIIEGGSNIPLNSNWGFGFGFYIYLVSLFIVIINIIYSIRIKNGEDLLLIRKRKK
jgi:hypothetical protein